MEPVHLHLLFNHLPILGSILAVAILAWGMLQRSRDTQRLSMLLLLVFGLATIPVFLTGREAEERVDEQPWFVEKIADVHEERAETALTAMLVTAGIAAAGLWLSRGGRRVPVAAGVLVLAAGTASFGLLAWTGLEGGIIRHDEIRTGSVVSPALPHEKEAPPAARRPHPHD